ncbi:MAG: hypothetical protein WCT37_01185 [Patescibacteria group bacterium]|jgi:hypothetical protein
MQCKNCQTEFNFLDKELAFYRQHDLSLPQICPVCRQLYRYASRNEINLYPRQCSACHKDIIAMYSADKPYLAYCSDCYWGDNWDRLDYGIDYDPAKSVFEHLKQLHAVTPHLASRVIQSQNSDYNNSASHDKDCYLSFRTHYSEGVFYSYWAIENRDSVDCFKITKSELLYQCVDCHQSYHCQYCLNCQNCLDCMGCVDCRNCQSCYLSSNLRNQKYVYQNQQLNQAEYEKLVQPFYTREAEKSFQQKYQAVIDGAFYAATNKINSPGCVGDNLLNCKDCYGSFEVIGSESSFFVLDALSVKDSVDVYSAGLKTEITNVYNSWGISNGAANIVASYDLQEGVSDAEYCQHCYASHDIFGCVNLRHHAFCIFNKQYSEEEYFRIKNKIVAKMKVEGIYGVFPPPEYSLFGYNESPAAFYHPMTKEEVLARGWQWREVDKKEFQPSDFILPNDIRETTDEVTKKIITCVECGRNYKIIKEELAFYRRMFLPAPDRCFYCRHGERLKLRNPFRLRRAVCAKCGGEMDTAFPVETKKRIYCEECYRKEIY